MALSDLTSLGHIFLICKTEGLIKGISQSNTTMACKLSKFSTKDHRSKKKKKRVGRAKKKQVVRTQEGSRRGGAKAWVGKELPYFEKTLD